MKLRYFPSLLAFFFFLLASTALADSEWNRLFTKSKDEAVIAFGSCIFFTSSPIWDSIRRVKPDVLLLLGDTTYLRDEDFGDVTRISARYAELRTDPGFSRLEQEVPIIATWDDHDFGQDNANREFRGKEASLLAHLQHWNSGIARPFEDSLALAFTLGPLRVIVADNRSFRDDPKLPDASQFGSRQMEWIRQKLDDVSNDAFIVFASGGQILSPADDHYETLGLYPQEQSALVQSLSNMAAPAVILSGDRHYAEVLRRHADGKTLWELTSSPLSARTIEIEKITSYPERLFTFSPRSNFGVLRVHSADSRHRAWVEYLDENGKQIVRYELSGLRR